MRKQGPLTGRFVEVFDEVLRKAGQGAKESHPRTEAQESLKKSPYVEAFRIAMSKSVSFVSSHF